MGSYSNSPCFSLYSSNPDSVASFKIFHLTLLPSLLPVIHLAYLKYWLLTFSLLKVGKPF